MISLWLIVMSPILLMFASIILITTIYNIILLYRGTLSAYYSLSGPIGLPFLGTALYYDIDQLHVWSYEQCKSKYGYSSNFIHYVPGLLILVLMQPADIAFVLGSEYEKFEKGGAMEKTMMWWCSGSMLVSEGAEHKMQRKSIQPLLQHGNMSNIITTVHTKLRKLIQFYTKNTKNEINIAAKNSQLTLDVIGEITFGCDLHALDDGEQSKYTRASMSILQESWARTTRPFSWMQQSMQKKGRDGVAVLDDVIERMVEQRRNEGAYDKKDVLNQLLQTKKSDAELRSHYLAQCKLLMIAGSDTTSFWISSVLYFLAKNPDCRKRLHAELDSIFKHSFTADHSELPTAEQVKKLPYLQAVLYETQRIQPSTPSIARKLKHGKLKLPSGTVITSDMTIAISFYGIHRNAGVWGQDADQFKPERWLVTDQKGHNQLLTASQVIRKGVPPSGAYLPFSAGDRQCVGQMFASTEAAIAIASLCRTFVFDLAVGYEKPKLSNAISMLYPDGLVMKIKER